MDAQFDKPLKDAVRIVRRRYACAWLDDDDLKQIALLAILEARAKGRPDPVGTDRRHQNNLDRQRCVYAILDGLRASYRQVPPSVNITLDDDEDAVTLLDNRKAPDTANIVQLRQAVALLDKKATVQQAKCAELLASGLTPDEVAKAMGIFPSRVSQLKRDIRNIISKAYDLD